MTQTDPRGKNNVIIVLVSNEATAQHLALVLNQPSAIVASPLPVIPAPVLTPPLIEAFLTDNRAARRGHLGPVSDRLHPHYDKKQIRKIRRV
jgi:hypothetical protein